MKNNKFLMTFLISTFFIMFGLSSVFSAIPTMTAATTTTADTNNDGTVDQITVTFNETVNIVDGNVADGLTSLALGNSCIIPNGDYVASGVTSLVISGLTGCTLGDTSITPTVTYTSVASCTTAGSICSVSTTGQMANAHQVTSTDGAAPVFVSASATTDTNIQLIFSESLAGGLVTFGAASQWTATGLTSSAATINGANVDLTVSSLGNTAFTASDFAFLTASGVIKDAANNAVLAFSAKTISDGQVPTTPSSINIVSNNGVTTLGKVGNTVTVTATVDSGTVVTGTIGGKATTTNVVSGTTATLTRILDGTETEGLGLDFTLVSTDIGSNSAIAVTKANIIDGSAVQTDFTVPTITSITIPGGTYKTASVMSVTVVSDGTGYTAGTININGVNVAASLSDNLNNAYTLTYTIINTNTDRTAGTTPATVTLIDSAGNPSAAFTTVTETGPVVIDAHSPFINSLAWNDVDGSTSISGTDTIVLNFSEAIDITTITALNLDTNLALSNSHTFGTTGNGMNFAWTSGNTILTITLGSDSTVAHLDTVNPTTSVLDVAGNSYYLGSSFSITDNIVPTLSSVNIASNNANTALAKIGDVVTVTFTSSETIGTPTVTIDGNTADLVTNTAGNTWTATRTMLTGDAISTVFSIGFSDVASNAGVAVTATTDSSSVTFDETAPTISAVSIPNVAMKVGDVVTATITVGNDAGIIYTLTSGTIGGFNLGSLTRVSSTSYTAQFTITNGGVDVTALSNIPVSNLILSDTVGNPSTAFTTPISQNTDSIDANIPTISSISIPNVAMKVNTIVTATITVGNDGGETYTLTSGTIGGFNLGYLTRVSSTSYTADFSITNGGVDVTALSNIPVSNLILSDIAGNPSTAFTTLISQNADSIDANAPFISSLVWNDVDSSTGISGTDTIVLNFSEAIDITTITALNLDTNLALSNSHTFGTTGNGMNFAWTSGNTILTITLGNDSTVAHADTVDPTTSVKDLNGNPDLTSSPLLINDSIVPILSSVNIASNNANTALAKIGDVVTVTFTSSETIGTPTVTINGNAADSVTHTTGNTWTATRTMLTGDTQGTTVFNIAFSDVALNAGTAVTATTDLSAVIFDKISPTLSTLTISSSNSNGPTLATNGNTISLSIIINEGIIQPTVVFKSGGIIINNTVTYTNTSPNNWVASYVVDVMDTAGAITYTLDFTDLAGNAIAQKTQADKTGGVTLTVSIPKFYNLVLGVFNSPLSSFLLSRTQLQATSLADYNINTVLNSNAGPSSEGLTSNDVNMVWSFDGSIWTSYNVTAGTGDLANFNQSFAYYVLDLKSTGLGKYIRHGVIN